MEVATVATTIHIRYTKNIRSTITMVHWGMDKKVIKLNTCKLEVVKTHLMTINNKVDTLTATIRMTCKEVGTMCIMKGTLVFRSTPVTFLERRLCGLTEGMAIVLRVQGNWVAATHIYCAEVTKTFWMVLSSTALTIPQATSVIVLITVIF
jgi:hypothetical protein